MSLELWRDQFVYKSQVCVFSFCQRWVAVGSRGQSIGDRIRFLTVVVFSRRRFSTGANCSQ